MFDGLATYEEVLNVHIKVSFCPWDEQMRTPWSLTLTIWYCHGLVYRKVACI